MAKLHTPHTSEQQLNAITKTLPGGRAFASKSLDSSTFRTFLSALVPEIERFESTYLQISEEHDINFADSLLESWEKSLGIPDDCFPGDGTLEERRLHVIIKLACMNVSTEEDMINLAAKLGVVVTITPLTTQFFPPYSIPYLPISLPEARFVWVIRGDDIASAFPPYAIPHLLAVGNTILSCVFNKVKPANVQLIFINTGDPIPSPDSGFSNGFDTGYGV